MTREPHTTTTTTKNPMSAEEIDAFLSEPHLGRLATIRADGFPHVTPIWFAWDGKEARFILGNVRLHTKNLEREPKAGLCVDIDYRVDAKAFSAGAQAVVLWGNVEFRDDERLRAQTYAEQASKYIGDWQSDDAYIAGRDAEDRRLCILTPVGRHSWDFRKAG